jgi:hypothetical protein
MSLRLRANSRILKINRMLLPRGYEENEDNEKRRYGHGLNGGF